MSSPKVSFVIPSYNSAAWLPHAIESCRKQTYLNIEIIVIDDGSTDSTPKLMEFYETDKRVKYFRLEKNVGRSEARNYGNQKATGEYICVLDADDVASPDRARLTADKLKKADFVHGSAEYMDILGGKIGEHTADVFKLDKAIKEGVNRIVHSTCGYRKAVADKIDYRGGDISALGLDDWAFQLEAASLEFRFDHIQQPIAAIREVGTSITATRDRQKVVEEKKKFIASMGVPA